MQPDIQPVQDALSRQLSAEQGLRWAWLRGGSLCAFACLLLAHLLGSGLAEFQYGLCSRLDQALQPGGRLLGALPREHGKSTLGTVSLVLRELCLAALDWGEQQKQEAAAASQGSVLPARRLSARVGGHLPPKHGNTRRAAGALNAASTSSGARAGLRHRPRLGRGPAPDHIGPGAGGRPRAGVPAPLRKRNILIIGANQQEASAKLRLVVAELEGNPLLRLLCGSGIAPLIDRKGHRVAYGDSEIVLACGSRVRALGFGSKVRGQLFGGLRPDLIILDDPEDDLSVASPLSRRRLRDWCDSALLNSLDVTRGSLVWLGTLLRHDSVLAQWLEEKAADAALSQLEGRRSNAPQASAAQASHLTEKWSSPEGICSVLEQSALDFRPGSVNTSPPGSTSWQVIRLAALDEQERPLWPQRWSLAALQARRAEIGARAFAQEYMNQPFSRELLVFSDSDWRVYPRSGLSLGPDGWYYEGEELSVALGIDPAIGGPGGAQPGHDYCAIAAVGLYQPDIDSAAADGIEGPETLARRQPRIFVLELRRAHMSFARQLEAAERMSEHWRARMVGIEAVAYQQALSQCALSRGMPVLSMRETRAKALRIEAMARHVSEGRVLLPASAAWAAELRREAAEYPSGAHDDQLDALARAIECALSLGTGRREVEGGEERRERSVMRRF
ncbi:phage terminase large subunit [bacterium]|nr:phage terminase large subunit [bacterium]